MIPMAATDAHLDSVQDRPVSYKQVEAVYRQIRSGLEASRATSDAADFYYGELEMRRLGARRVSAERLLLTPYKWLGGFGVRALPPLLSYLATVVGTSVLLWRRPGWFATTAITSAGAGADSEGRGGLAFTHLDSVFAFVVRNSISVFTTPVDGLTALGTVLLVAERFASIAMLGTAVLAIRSRVHR
jgi:hypothetical protein